MKKWAFPEPEFIADDSNFEFSETYSNVASKQARKIRARLDNVDFYHLT
jgi:hypothetical protein